VPELDSSHAKKMWQRIHQSLGDCLATSTRGHATPLRNNRDEPEWTGKPRYSCLNHGQVAGRYWGARIPAQEHQLYSTALDSAAIINSRMVVRRLLPVGIRREFAFTDGPTAFVAADCTPWVISCVLDSIDDSRFVTLIIFDQFPHAFSICFGVCGQRSCVSRLHSAFQLCLHGT